jgi:hypothetical protein
VKAALVEDDPVPQYNAANNTSIIKAGTPRRIPRPDHLSSFYSAAAAGQRLYPLDLFARLLINGCVAEVDVPVQARVGVVLVVGSSAGVEGIANWH